MEIGLDLAQFDWEKKYLIRFCIILILQCSIIYSTLKLSSHYKHKKKSSESWVSSCFTDKAEWIWTAEVPPNRVPATPPRPRMLGHWNLLADHGWRLPWFRDCHPWANNSQSGTKREKMHYHSYVKPEQKRWSLTMYFFIIMQILFFFFFFFIYC